LHTGCREHVAACNRQIQTFSRKSMTFRRVRFISFFCAIKSKPSTVSSRCRHWQKIKGNHLFVTLMLRGPLNQIQTSPLTFFRLFLQLLSLLNVYIIS